MLSQAKRPILKSWVGWIALFGVWMLIAPSGVFARKHSKPSQEAGKTEQANRKAKHVKARKSNTDVFYPTPP